MTTSFVYITSKNRESDSTSASDFIIRFNPALKVPSKKLELVTAIVPQSIYNVTTSNQLVDFTWNGVKQVTLTVGYYNATQLAAQLQTQMNTVAGGPAFTVAFDSKTQYYTIAEPAANVTMLFSTGAAAGTANNNWKLFGFVSSTGLAAVDSAAALSVTSNAATQLYQPDMMMVEFEVDGCPLMESRINANPQRSTSLVIPLLDEYASLNPIYSPEFPYTLHLKEEFIKELRVRLTDDTGTTLAINNAYSYFLFKS